MFMEIYTVEITDANGCRNTGEVEIEEEPCDPIFYNVITPNGDPTNQYWVIENFDNTFAHLVQIFNRWGQVVLETNKYDNKWDGDDLPDGTYYYIVSYNAKTYTGTITKISSDKK